MRSHLRISTCLLATIPLMAAPNDVRSASPFESITIAGAISGNSNDNAFHEFWDPKPGGRLEAQTPFYAGYVRLGVHYFKSSSKSDSVRSFRTTSLYLVWGDEWGVGDIVFWGLGAQSGVFIIDAAESIFGNRKEVESELAFGVNTRLRYEPFSEWSVFAAFDYQKVYTRRQIEMTFVTVGVSRRFSSPGWFRRFFE